MAHINETIQVFVPLKIRKKNGRPKILPPADQLSRDERMQDPHILRAIGRAWGWRQKMETGQFATVVDLAAKEKLSDRFVSRQLRLAYLAPELLRTLLVERRHVAVTVQKLIEIADTPWCDQIKQAL